MSRYAPPVPRPVAAPAQQSRPLGGREAAVGSRVHGTPPGALTTPKSDRNRSFAGAFGEARQRPGLQRAQHEPGSVVDPVIREPASNK